MGMDVYAVNPVDEDHEYFRANCWSWRPIHDFMSRTAGHLYSEDVDDGMSINDGIGLTADEVEDVADSMEKVWAEISPHADGLELESSCHVVSGTNKFATDKERDDPNIDTESAYRVPMDRLKEWIEFVRYSGGFEVW